MKNWWIRLIATLIIERPARRLSFAEQAARLAAGGQTIAGRLAAAADTAANRTHIRHIIGIERWGQRRLLTALGDPPISDEYDGYRPAERPLTELAATFAAARQESIALARRLETQPSAADARVAHNQFGPLSAHGWLRYLNVHANGESLRIK